MPNIYANKCTFVKMLLLCSKLTFAFLFFGIVQVKSCKREDLHYLKITEKPTPLDASKNVVNIFRTLHGTKSLILGLEGLSPCPQNIQQYEDMLQDAQIIEVHNHFVSVLQQGDVQHLVFLDSLLLDDNNIQDVQPGAFLNVPNLKIISLIDNSIKEIQGGVFSNLTIEKLYLRNNNINNIAPEAFDNLPNLLEIDLSNNRLANLNEHWFSAVPKVQEVLLNFNELLKIREGAFNNIKESLEVLDLSNNNIEEISPTVLRELKQLRKLSLENNKFKCVSDEVLKAFPVNLTLSFAPNDHMQCLCWNKLQKWSFKYYANNKDTIFFIVRHAEIQCNDEIVGMLHDALSRISALEKH